MPTQLKFLDDIESLVTNSTVLDTADNNVMSIERLKSSNEDIVSLQNIGLPTPVISALAQFESYQLTDLKKANLMNRVDSKFMLPMSFLPTLLSQLTNDYKVLDIDGKRCFTYQNQYLDTPEMDLYTEHHNGKLNRYKVRQRRYVDTATEYLEVKLKNNKKRTIKTRIKISNDINNDNIRNDFIKGEMNGQNLNLNVVQQSGYQRIALANEEKAERLTLDFNLWYKSTDGKNEVNLPGFFIAELKQSKKSKNSPFYQLMSKYHVFPASFSKYCVGCALLYPDTLKANRFKSVLTRTNHLNNQNPLSLVENL